MCSSNIDLIIYEKKKTAQMRKIINLKLKKYVFLSTFVNYIDDFANHVIVLLHFLGVIICVSFRYSFYLIFRTLSNIYSTFLSYVSTGSCEERRRTKLHSTYYKVETCNTRQILFITLQFR